MTSKLPGLNRYSAKKPCIDIAHMEKLEHERLRKPRWSRLLGRIVEALPFNVFSWACHMTILWQAACRKRLCYISWCNRNTFRSSSHRPHQPPYIAICTKLSSSRYAVFHFSQLVLFLCEIADVRYDIVMCTAHGSHGNTGILYLLVHVFIACYNECKQSCPSPNVHAAHAHWWHVHMPHTSGVSLWEFWFVFGPLFTCEEGLIVGYNTVHFKQFLCILYKSSW